ncbi:unnamed protein product, partial [Rotaria sp. Silwood1]
MISKLETLPDEILLDIFSYLSWDKILISLWSINRRINYVIYSIFSMKNSGIVFNQSDLSYKKFSSILLPLISNSSYLSSLIKYIHFDGTYSNSYNIINKCLYNQQILCFPNLKSLNITRCLLSQSLIQTLSLLIQNQLEQLTLTFDKDILILLRLDIGDDDNPLNIYECLTSCSNPSSTSISNKNQYCCWTLRYLYVGLKYTSFLEHLIERLSVSKLNYFTLKVFVHSDFEFAYLKWILNNLNHIEKFKLHLEIHKIFDPNIFTWPFIKSISIDLHPFLYLFFEQFNELFPNVSHIKNDSNTIELNKARAKVFTHLISMPVQLEYLLVEKVEWLFHIIQYVSNELKINALSNIQCAEFGIPSCYYGSNDSVHIGKNLVPFLSTYMPQLQTLYLWRPDDFAWTS